jgi:hypothetical protein
MKTRGGLIVDLGNVIIAHWLSKVRLTRANFHKVDYSSIPEVPGAFRSLKGFNTLFGGNVTVVYKATNVATEKVLAWLKRHRFSERTGIAKDRVVRTKKGRDKTAFMRQSTKTHYGTTVVVDDRLEVLSHFVAKRKKKKVPHLFLFRPRPREVGKWKKTGALDHVYVVQTWQEVEGILK